MIKMSEEKLIEVHAAVSGLAMTGCDLKVLSNTSDVISSPAVYACLSPEQAMQYLSTVQDFECYRHHIDSICNDIRTQAQALKSSIESLFEYQRKHDLSDILIRLSSIANNVSDNSDKRPFDDYVFKSGAFNESEMMSGGEGSDFDWNEDDEISYNPTPEEEDFNARMAAEMNFSLS